MANDRGKLENRRQRLFQGDSATLRLINLPPADPADPFTTPRALVLLGLLSHIARFHRRNGKVVARMTAAIERWPAPWAQAEEGLKLFLAASHRSSDECRSGFPHAFHRLIQRVLPAQAPTSLTSGYPHDQRPVPRNIVDGQCYTQQQIVLWATHSHWDVTMEEIMPAAIAAWRPRSTQRQLQEGFAFWALYRSTLENFGQMASYNGGRGTLKLWQVAASESTNKALKVAERMASKIMAGNLAVSLAHAAFGDHETRKALCNLDELDWPRMVDSMFYVWNSNSSLDLFDHLLRGIATWSPQRLARATMKVEDMGLLDNIAKAHPLAANQLRSVLLAATLRCRVVPTQQGNSAISRPRLRS